MMTSQYLKDAFIQAVHDSENAWMKFVRTHADIDFDFQYDRLERAHIIREMMKNHNLEKSQPAASGRKEESHADQ